jgi:cytochrome c-type protein NapB
MALIRRSILLVAFLALAGGALAQEAAPPQPIRGPTPIPETNPSEAFKYDRSDRPIPRNFPQHPPIIPHNIKGYQITKNVNMCMSCHAKTRAPTTGATPVGRSHYLDRDGKELPNISARRYFCLQCHVPQFNADPLVANTFRGPTK